MKTFNKPYLKVVNLDLRENVSTACVLECSCDIESCTCNQVCGCDDDCIVIVQPSK